MFPKDLRENRVPKSYVTERFRDSTRNLVSIRKALIRRRSFDEMYHNDIELNFLALQSKAHLFLQSVR